MNRLHVIAAVIAVCLAACSKAPDDQRACTAPLANWNKPHPHMGPERATLRIALDHNGNMYLDGARLDSASLAKMLREASHIGPPDPVFILETEMGAPCPRLNEVRDIMTRELKCGSGGHCDEGAMSVWDKLEVTGPIP